MTELRRLLETSEHDDERAWLLAAHDEMPSASGMRDAALALGLTTVTESALAASVPAAASTAPVLGGGGASVVKVATTTSLSVLGKGLLGGAMVSFLALSTLDHTLGSSSNSATPVATTSARPAEPSPATATLIEQTRSNAPEPDAPQAGPRVARRATTRASSPAPTETPRLASDAPARAMFEPPPMTSAGVTTQAASLARETQLLDRARRALAAGDWDQADRSLAAYYAGAPSPVLALEATQLKARLLVARGDRPAAAALARRTIQNHPESAHVLLLQQLANEP